jgi:hypothetical protein
MKKLEITDIDYKKIINLIKKNDELYEIENWTIDDLNAFRIIGTKLINLINEYINNQKNA